MTTNHRGRRSLLLSFALAAVLVPAAGCITQEQLKNPKSIQVESEHHGDLPAAPAPVTADQVNAQNAHATLQALRDELARER
jgi:hypothetical protein